MIELELGDEKDLLDMFPSARHVIEEFCPPHGRGNTKT